MQRRPAERAERGTSDSQSGSQVNVDPSRLGELIARATKTGEQALDADHVKDIKSIVRTSEDAARSAYECVLAQLKTKHSQIRLLATLLADELFMRSKTFRACLVEDLRTFIELAIGTSLENPLPPPEFAAVALREKALEAIERWDDEHGSRYKQLGHAMRYLKEDMRMRFPEIRANAARRRQDEERRRAETQRLLSARFEQLRREWPEKSVEMAATLDEMDAAFGALLEHREGPAGGGEGPGPGEEPEEEALEPEEAAEYNHRRAPGAEAAVSRALLAHGGLSITVDRQAARQGAENEPLYAALGEALRVVEARHAPLAAEWADTLTRWDPPPEMSSARESFLRDVLVLRQRIANARGRAADVGVTSAPLPALAAPGADGEEALEEGDWEAAVVVPAARPAPQPRRSGRPPSSSSPSSAQPRGIPARPAPGSTGTSTASSSSSSRPADERGAAAAAAAAGPSVAESLAANYRGLAIEGHWGRFEADAVVDAAHVERLMAAGLIPCRAPLRSGALCPRRDLYRCPHHGPIVERDEEGNPLPQASAGQNREPSASQGAPPPALGDAAPAGAPAPRELAPRGPAPSASSGAGRGAKRSRARSPTSSGAAGRGSKLVALSKPPPDGPLQRLRKRIAREAKSVALLHSERDEASRRDAAANRW
eukprot:tig00001336_g8223.t1